jgi:hypothetical protein
MTYDIFTTCNEAYYPFLENLITSIERNCENVGNIYIGNSGLSRFNQALKREGVIELFQEGLTAEFQGVHQAGWYKATALKTRFLHKLLHVIDEDRPLILIDNDTLVLKDLEPLINTDYDIQVTHMEKGEVKNAAGLTISNIASFMIINNRKKMKRFTERWVELMSYYLENEVRPPHETPAMNALLRENVDPVMKIEELPEQVTCRDVGYNSPVKAVGDETYTIHFKSSGSNSWPAGTNFTRRVRGVTLPDGTKYNPVEWVNAPLQWDAWCHKYLPEFQMNAFTELGMKALDTVELRSWKD